MHFKTINSVARLTQQGCQIAVLSHVLRIFCLILVLIDINMLCVEDDKTNGSFVKSVLQTGLPDYMVFPYFKLFLHNFGSS